MESWNNLNGVALTLGPKEKLKDAIWFNQRLLDLEHLFISVYEGVGGNVYAIFYEICEMVFQFYKDGIGEGANITVPVGNMYSSFLYKYYLCVGKV